MGKRRRRNKNTGKGKVVKADPEMGSSTQAAGGPEVAQLDMVEPMVIQQSVTLDDLPDELMERIFLYLSPPDLVRCSLVSKRWNNITTLNQHLWQALVLKDDSRRSFEELTLLHEDFLKKFGPWKAFYHLRHRRIRNWRDDKYLTLQSEDESSFFEGWASFGNTCFISNYTENALQVFRVSMISNEASLVMDQTIWLPVTGLERILVFARPNLVAVVRSNIILIYKKTKTEYVLDRLFACKSRSIIRFTGDIKKKRLVEDFITYEYVRDGMVELIDFEENMTVLCDCSSDTLFFISNESIHTPRWEKLTSFNFFKIGRKCICFWTKTYLVLIDKEGNIVFDAKDLVIDCISFNEQYLGVKVSNREVIRTYDVKKKEFLIEIPASHQSTFLVQNDAVVILQPNFLKSYSIIDGTEKWSFPFVLTQLCWDPPNECKMHVILDKYLLIFPPIRPGHLCKIFSTLDIDTGQFLYSSTYVGSVVDISDILLVTWGRIGYGNTFHIRCY